MKKVIITLTILTLLLAGCAPAQTTSSETQTLDSTASSQSEQSSSSTENEQSNTLTVTDVAGSQLSLNQKPSRVIALYGSFADLWYEAGGELVGICEASRLPEQAANVERVGSMSTPNVEAILALQPDLVIVREGYEKQQALIPILQDNDIAVYQANYNNFDEMSKVFKDFCTLNQNDELYGQKIDPIIAEIKSITSHSHQFSYLLLFSTSKSVSAKDDNTAAEIINATGGDNITSQYQIADEKTKQFSFEKVLEADPDYIFVQTMGSVEDAKARLEEDIYSNPAWSSLTAVKEGRFYYLPKDLFLYKPNLRYAEAYQYISDILHGVISADQ